MENKKIMENKKRFSNVGFILAAIGSAVGLGNLWLFPTKLIEFGGAAFFIPYIIALITIGLPFLILETTLGNKWRRSPIITFKNYWKKTGSFFGCLQALVQFMIGTYYVWIIGWVFLMIINSFTSDFGSSLTQFDDDYLTDNTGGFWAGMNGVQSLLIVIVILTATYFIVIKGIKKGVELANKIMIPTLFILLIGFFIYSFTIDGMALGINEIFAPDFSKLGNFQAWAKAFGQALFSLSLVSAILMIYSAKAPKDRDNVTQSIIIVSGDTLIAMIGSFIIAATIGGIMTNGLTSSAGSYVLRGTVDGNISAAQLGSPDNLDFAFTDGWDKLTLIKTTEGIPIFEENIGGSTLIFKTFPIFFKGIGTRINWQPLGNIFGIFFFLSAFFAGFSSIIGEVEIGTSILEENTKIKRNVGAMLTVLTQFFFGIVFVYSKNKDALFAVTDGIFVTWLLLFLALQQTIMFAFKPKAVHELAIFNNKRSKIKINKIFAHVMICIGLAVITFVIVVGIYGNIQNPDSDLLKVSAGQWTILSILFWLPTIGWPVAILWYKKKTGFKIKKMDYEE